MGLPSEGIHGAYGRLPIIEIGEPLRDIPEQFSRLLPHPYMAAGAPYEGRSPWYLRTGVLKALCQAHAALQQRRPGWQIAIFDAWRPLEVQAYMVWRQFAREAEQESAQAKNTVYQYDNPEDLRRGAPHLYQRLASRVYQFWGVANADPLHPPPHSTGAAVDLTLLARQGQEIPMGGPVDDFSARATPDHFAQAPAGSPESSWHEHRQILREIMEAAGFAQHPGEWWHFSLGDQLWAWQKGIDSAHYGRIQTMPR